MYSLIVLITSVCLTSGIPLKSVAEHRLATRSYMYHLANEVRFGNLTGHKILTCSCGDDDYEAGIQFSRIRPNYDQECEQYFKDSLGYCRDEKQILSTGQHIYCLMKLSFGTIYNLTHLKRSEEIPFTNCDGKRNAGPCLPSDIYIENKNNKSEFLIQGCTTNDIAHMIRSSRIFNYTDSYQYQKNFSPRIKLYDELCRPDITTAYDFDISGQEDHCQQQENLSVTVTNEKIALVVFADVINRQETSTTTTTSESLPSIRTNVPTKSTSDSLSSTTFTASAVSYSDEWSSTERSDNGTSTANEEKRANVIQVVVIVTICGMLIVLVLCIIYWRHSLCVFLRSPISRRATTRASNNLLIYTPVPEAAQTAD